MTLFLYTFPRAVARPFAGGELAADAVRQTFGDGAAVSYRADGAPKITGACGFISAAHTENFALLALSNFPVGVDIERTTRKTRHITHSFSADEREFCARGRVPAPLLDVPPELLVFTAKEAALKIGGATLSNYKKTSVATLRGLRETLHEMPLRFLCKNGLIITILGAGDIHFVEKNIF